MAPTRGRRSTRGRPDKAAVYGRLERHNHGTMDNERSENESGKLENNTATSTEEGQEQGSEQEAMETSAETGKSEVLTKPVHADQNVQNRRQTSTLEASPAFRDQRAGSTFVHPKDVAKP